MGTFLLGTGAAVDAPGVADGSIFDLWISFFDSRGRPALLDCRNRALWTPVENAAQPAFQGIFGGGL